MPRIPLVLLATLALSWPTPSAAATEKATILEILDGEELYIDQKKAVVRQQAATPQQISTKNSRGQLGFEGGAAGRINRFSALKLGRSCFLLERGQILVSGAQNGCTRSARMSVRGTNYIITLSEGGNTELAVLEGTVEVESMGKKDQKSTPPQTITAGQKLTLTPEGIVLSLLSISASDYNSLLSGPLFTGFQEALPGMADLERYLRTSLPGVSLPSGPSLRTPIMPSVPSIPGGRFF